MVGPARHFVRELPSRNLDRLAAEISAAASRHEIHALALITNLMVSAILVVAAIALTGQIHRTDRATNYQFDVDMCLVEFDFQGWKASCSWQSLSWLYSSRRIQQLEPVVLPDQDSRTVMRFV